MMENGYSLSDIAAATGNGGNGNNGFGNGDGWWIILLFIFIAAFGGWGNGMFGGGNAGGVSENYTLISDMGQIERKLDGVYSGICDSTFSLNNTITNGFAAVQNTLTQGFAGLNTGMVQQGYETRIAVGQIGTQLASCCCDVKEQIANTNYNLATQANGIQRQIETGFCNTNYNLANNTRDIVDNNHADTDRIIARLDAMENARQAERIAQLQSENQGLRFAASQQAQNAFIVQNQAAQTAQILDKLSPCPRPAYLTCNPNAPLDYTIQYGNNNGCGCC